ncbi:IS605 OrfB family transposase [Saccharopolyspora lacisalsi]|uniref:IS605 OrfB family transposase n=1 Tax=Halosaccharopolyspora lacisalsi TaxID=1000566 RepID=A0A839DYW4_9PSEU|nr:RNA-guided endonuclease TnpB family protein [Halosaccharopolyspora lacisalsi]MBA8824565.1 IS605 OrfB family transposase [Halosaccharopolyspora lacisalsi]
MKAQRELSRKQPGSNNRARARREVARVHARITDRRRDHLHQVSTGLVRENQTVVIEDLQVRGMLANHSLACALGDASWSQFRTMLEYEAAWCGREVIVIDRGFPSSKTCPACGRLTAKKPLHVRTWACAGCNTTHVRDVNAAKNIKVAGLVASACGAGVRPQRETSRTGQSARKQEPSTARPKENPGLQDEE